jgi:arylsulfatase A-like enzyme
MCQGTMCGPSRNCLITGTYPHQLGFYQNGDMRKLPEDAWVLPKALRHAGYQTAWIGKSHLKPWFSKRGADTFDGYFGFDYSLHTLGRTMLGGGGEDKEAGSAPNPYTDHLKARGLWDKFLEEAKGNKNTTLAEDDYLDGWFTRHAVDYIAAYQETRPLFLWLNYSLPHDPYDVPDAYHAPFATAKVPGLGKPENFTVPASLMERTKEAKSEAAITAHQRGYHAAIHYLDGQIGRVIAALERKGMLGNTWIVFFSDQGVMQGSLGLLHKHTLFRQITQPALIIRPPAGKDGGKRVDYPVELTDLLPTMLELAGSQGKAPAGVSLLPVFSGGKPAREFTFCEIYKWIAVSDGTHRLLRSTTGEAPLLFNDRADPENRVNLAAKSPEVVARLSKAIDTWLAATGARKEPKAL